MVFSFTMRKPQQCPRGGNPHENMMKAESTDSLNRLEAGEGEGGRERDRSNGC